MDYDLYEMINGFPPTTDVSLPTVTTFTPTITTTPFVPENNSQMLDDWGLHAIVNGIPPTVDASVPCFTTTTSIPTIPTNNNRLLNDQGLYAIVSDFCLTHNVRLPSVVTTTTSITTITTTPIVPINNNQMLNDWGLEAVVNGYYPTHNVRSSSGVATTTPTTPINNNQRLNDWGLNATANCFYPAHNVCLSSPMATTTSVPTTPTMPTSNHQILNNWSLDANARVDGSYPIHNTRFSSVTSTITTPVMPIPTFSNAPVMLPDNHQALENTISWDSHVLTNTGFSSNVFPSSSSPFTHFTTTPMTSTIYNNQNWKQHTMSNSNFGSSSSFLGATTTPSTNVWNSSYQGERLNQYDYPMNVNNIKKLMKNFTNPINMSKPPLSSKSWPILTLPILGKLTDEPSHKQQQNQLQRSHDLFGCTNINAQISSNSNQGKTEKRVYKMPVEALNNDMWSWKKYGEKFVDGSPHPRVYYKCISSKDCTAKRRVEMSASEPDSVTLKYTGYHNHSLPRLMNYSVDNVIAESASSSTATNKDYNKPSSSKAISQPTAVNYSNMSKNYCIFEEKENLGDSEENI